LFWRNLQHDEVTASCCEVNDLIERLFAEALPAVRWQLMGSFSICVKAVGLVFSNALIGRSDLAWETPKVPKR